MIGEKPKSKMLKESPGQVRAGQRFFGLCIREPPREGIFAVACDVFPALKENE